MSLVISAVIVWGTWGLLREVVRLSLDAVPAGIDPPQVRGYLGALPGVASVHDLHIWAMSTTENGADLPSRDAGRPSGRRVPAARLPRTRAPLRRSSHATIQIEIGDASVRSSSRSMWCESDAAGAAQGSCLVVAQFADARRRSLLCNRRPGRTLSGRAARRSASASSDARGAARGCCAPCIDAGHALIERDSVDRSAPRRRTRVTAIEALGMRRNRRKHRRQHQQTSRSKHRLLPQVNRSPCAQQPRRMYERWQALSAAGRAPCPAGSRAGSAGSRRAAPIAA